MSRIVRVLSVVVILSSAGLARAAESVETSFEGITITRRTLREPRPLSLHLVRVDLTAPGLSVESSPGSGEAPGIVRARRVDTVARDEGYSVCVNAGIFRPMALSEGMAVTVDGPAVRGGVEFAPVRQIRPVLCVDRDGRMSIRMPPLGDVREAMAGFDTPLCLEEGEVGGPVGRLQPRTAAGVSKDGRTLVLLVVDGRQPGVSEGATLHEVGAWLRDAGAWNGINLDGGGSTTLVVNDAAGARVLNVPVGLSVPGSLRPVATCLGIRARPVPGASSMGTSPGAPTEEDRGSGTVATILLAAGVVLLVVLVLLVRRGRSRDA